MAVIRWFGEDEASSQVDNFKRELDRLANNFWSFANPSTGRNYRPGVYPPLNIFDDKECYIVRAEVPGVDPKSLDVTVAGDTLSIQGERKLAESPEGSSYHRRERDHGQFRRALNLPEYVESGKVVATCEDGILEIRLPRAEQSKQRKIKIQAS